MHRPSPFCRQRRRGQAAASVIVTFATLSVFALPAQAQSSSQSGPTPEVMTVQEAGQTLKEYRVDGKLYAIRIIPADGPAYFLLDATGGGNFERVDQARVAVPDWVRAD
ncbi:DUF2782 domain-containing protein [Salinicola aestuarinus]|uniref:DUF2782 domain-containing protein n=1 Tax=Salinicola aestuarinus TaxID=1949082 RepID=UPI000DA20A72|nr:DUF2782 domain-containing protein [Salinicola aestuarinus]